MRRIIFGIFMAALFVPAGYFGSEALRELTEMTEVRQEREQANRARILRILKADERYTFQQVVVGPDDAEQKLDFRARAYRDGIGQAAYGAIRTDCALPATAPDCWELASLYVDGLPIEQSERQAAAPADTDTQNTNVTLPPVQTSTEIATSVESVDRLVVTDPLSDATSQPLATVTPQLQPGTDVRPTHTVGRSLVNARNAPRGTALVQLPQNTPLRMLDRQGGWGHFQVLDGLEAGLEVWIALSVLDAL